MAGQARVACKALFASRSRAAGGGNDIPATLIVLLSVIVGAVLSPLVTLMDAVARRRKQADALRSAAHAFVSATETFIRGWTGPSGAARPPDQDVRVRRSELAA